MFYGYWEISINDLNYSLKIQQSSKWRKARLKLERYYQAFLESKHLYKREHIVLKSIHFDKYLSHWVVTRIWKCPNNSH